MKINRLKNIEYVHYFELVKALAAKHAMAVINNPASLGGLVIQSLFFNPCNHPLGVDEQQKLRREKEKKDRRHIQGQNQRNMENKSQINRGNPRGRIKKQENKEDFAGQDDNPEAITQLRLLRQEIPQQKIFGNARGWIMHQGIDRITADPVTLRGNLVKSRVQIRKSNLQL